MKAVSADPSVAFRRGLQEDLLRRIQRNPRFSLRSYARLLKYDPSTLAKILNGTRRPGARTIRYLSDRLGLSADSQNSPAELIGLSLEQFRLIADWYHYAILELMKLKAFKPDSKWIAQRIGIPNQQAVAAIEHLKLAGMIREQNGKWIEITTGRTTTKTIPGTNRALRKMQRQILEQAIEAMETIPFEERDQSSITIALNQKDIAAAREEIRAFRRRISNLLSAAKEYDRVYQLSISFFPLDGTKSS